MELSSRKFEIHYYFSDNSHTMNALVKNKCEAEFLAVASEVAAILGIPFELDSEVLREGGLRESWKALGDNNSQVALIISSLALIWSVIPHTDQELLNLQKEDKKLSIEERKLSIKKLKQELEEQSVSQESVEVVASLASINYKVVTRKSNFYKTLSGYQKVTNIGFSELNIKGESLTDERIVNRKYFSNFIISSNELESSPVNSARIEIVAPVLKEGRAKWKGIYNEESISFSMNDLVFKEAVLSKQLSFKNGDEIICVLLIHKKLNELGEIITSGYTVEVVLENLESGLFKETPQGKAYKHTKKLMEGQFDMFGSGTT
jgi:hypothetical protein